MSATTPKVNGRRAPRVVEAGADSEQTGLADALLAFHARAPKLRTNADGQIQSRTYRYVTLDALLDDVEPLLLECGLLWTAKVTVRDGAPAALYRIEHVPSREFDEWTGPLPCAGPGPQNLGSAITYMRRYTLVAYLNLAPGEDDDGAAASMAPPVDRYAEAEAAHNAATGQPSAAPPKPSERPASAKQRGLIEARARAIDLTAAELANVLKKAGGEEPTVWQDGAAERWSARALDRLPARLVDDVLAGIAAKA